MRRAHRQAAGRRGRAAFTLLEILLAMSILLIIVLIVSRIFQQSSVAWDSGTRKTEMSLTGRTLADFMAQEVAQAVEDGDLFAGEFSLSGAVLEFVMIGTPDGGQRGTYKIRYSFGGNTLTRRSERFNYAGSSWGASQLDTLAEGVEEVQFIAPGWSGAGLPRYVDVLVTALSEADREKGFLARRQVYQSRAWLFNRDMYR